MTFTSIVGGVTLTIVILASVIVFSVAGMVFMIRYILPLAIALALIVLIVDFVKKRVCA